jgi:hypothetical protein
VLAVAVTPCVVRSVPLTRARVICQDRERECVCVCVRVRVREHVRLRLRLRLRLLEADGATSHETRDIVVTTRATEVAAARR